MSAKSRLKLLKAIFKESGIDLKVFENIENKCISMNHLGFSDKDLIYKMNEEVKNYIENSSERYRFNFVDIAEKYDFDISFLD